MSLVSMSRPPVLALIMIEQARDAICALEKSGLKILVVEQNIGLALEVCDRFVVLRAGQQVYDQPKVALGTDPRQALAAPYM
jgi:branched-chain amino acid transport system ATP-binding protein